MTTEISRQFIVAAGLISATFLVHGVFVVMISAFLRSLSDNMRGLADMIRDVFVLMAISVALLVAHLTSIWIWAISYMKLGGFLDLETSLYFAAATYTTLGYGDVLPPEEWRILSGAMAANGLLLFGLSAAVLVDASVRLRLGRE